MKAFIERMFHLEANNTTVRIELLGGMTTFMTMSYIIFVQPALLSGTGMDRGAVMVATCLASAIATLFMGLLARYPIALAPGMGLNVFFAVTVCGVMGHSWNVALGAVFISGVLFFILSVLKVWDKLVNAVPNSMKHAIAVGIGLFITLIGLEYGGIVVDTPGSYIGIGDMTSKPVILVLVGVVVTASEAYSPSSWLRRHAAMTASQRWSKTRSSAIRSMAAWVVPPGEATFSRSTSGGSPDSNIIRAAPRQACFAKMSACCRGSPARTPASVSASTKK